MAEQEQKPRCADCGKPLWPLMDQEVVDGRLYCGRCALYVKRRKRQR